MPGGDEVELELLAVADDGVPGVVAALVADDHVALGRQQIGDLALALVAPLGADHDCPGHHSPFLVGVSRPDIGGRRPVCLCRRCPPRSARTRSTAAAMIERAARTPDALACTSPRRHAGAVSHSVEARIGVCSPASRRGRAE